MRNGESDSLPVHYVEVDQDLCNGCVLCMKACPMRAIRVRDGVARIEGVCIDCMECSRVCPRGAIRGVSTTDLELDNREEYVVCPSTVLYSQFGEDYLPNDVLLGLRKMGFRYVHDQSYTCEIYDFATELYIQELRKRAPDSFPLISRVCPAVVQLIAYRFPSLMSHVSPLATPREIVSRETKRRLSTKHGCPEEEIKVLHITPCPAIMVRENARGGQDLAIGIHTIYDELQKAVREVEEDKVLHYSGGIGLGWGISGGEIAGVNAKCIAVSGVYETIRYLEKVEMGLLTHIKLLECRICNEGCVGGPFAVADRYQTKQLVQKFVRMFGVERRIKQNYVLKLYREGWFESGEEPAAAPQKAPPENLYQRIERQRQVEAVLKLLPERHCGVCGSPDCRTFAEDVVAGRAELGNCLYRREQKNNGEG